MDFDLRRGNWPLSRWASTIIGRFSAEVEIERKSGGVNLTVSWLTERYIYRLMRFWDTGLRFEAERRYVRLNNEYVPR